MRSTSSFVTRISPGPVMAFGMALIGGGILAPATTALILRRKRASDIDGAVPALEVGGVN